MLFTIPPPRKLLWFALLLAGSASGQKQPVSLPSSCGVKETSFDVKLDNTKHSLAQPGPGKALIYFIQQAGSRLNQINWRVPTVLLGIDGAWVGAYNESAWFAMEIAPGEHHVCTLMQGQMGLLIRDQVETADFVAEANHVYYFRTREIAATNTEYLFLDAVDRDQALYRIASYPRSVSKQKK